MTRSLQLDQDGDLAVRSGSIRLVSGRRKLEQDLSCWLRESFRVDRFHRSYGSVIGEYIGEVVSAEALFHLRAEVLRVLSNYQENQIRAIEREPSLFTPGQILRRVQSVDVSAFYDRVYVEVVYETAAGETDMIEVSIDE